MSTLRHSWAVPSGIDLFARKKLAEKYTVYQCKRENDFGPAKISAAVQTFLDGTWLARSDQLVLCTKEDLRTTQRTEEVETQRELLTAMGIALSIWDASELNIQLKQHPIIVDDFFGREWVRDFCGEQALQALQDRLDGPKTSNIRAKLRTLYAATFKGDDPGLPTNMSDSRYLPLEERYVVPDILTVRMSSTESSSEEASPESAAKPGEHNSGESSPIAVDRRTQQPPTGR